MEFQDDDNSYRRRLQTNMAYLNRISSILDTKCKYTPGIFFDEKGQELENKIVIISDSQENSVSILKKSGGIKVALNGTDFVSKMYISEDKTRFVYENETLGVKYSFSERDLVDGACERIIVKTVDDTTIRVKYYVKGDYLLIAEFLSQSKGCSDCVAIQNMYVKEMSDSEISRYLDEQMLIGLEYAEDEEHEEDDEYEEIDEYEEDDQEELNYDTQNLDVGELEIDDSIVPEEDDEVNIKTQAREYKLHAYDFPYRVEDFDFDDYMKFERSLEIEEEQADDETICTDYCEFDDTICYISNIENDQYRVYYEEPIDNPDLKSEVIDMIYDTVVIENTEVMDLVECITEIDNDYENAVKLIRIQHEKSLRNKRKKGNPDPSDSGAENR